MEGGLKQMAEIIQTKIQDVWIKPLLKLPDERGMIMHMLRADEHIFEKFGEIYFSIGLPGVIKGWHHHTRQSQNYAVIQGMIKLVLYDDRESSTSKGVLIEIFTGEDKYELIHIPPGITNGYKTYGTKPAIVANCADLPHDPHEIIRYNPLNSHIDYNWDIMHC